jgi:hypothetical protein
MSEDNWVVIYSSPEPHTTEIVRGMLEENGIICIVRNYGDSTMLLPARYDLYVGKDDALNAKHLIQKTIDDEFEV